MKQWWARITTWQKLWIFGSTALITLLGIASGDSWINVLIGSVGMFYVAVYSTGARGAFLLGVAYVSLYTIICLENKIMLDALQNIILIPIYVYSFIRWGKHKTQPKNIGNGKAILVTMAAFATMGILYWISKALGGNYSELDSLNTTCTLFAMVLGMYGLSMNWALWSINNLASAVTFGLALSTPTGSPTVFAMKVVFFINGLIGWYTFNKMAKGEDIKLPKETTTGG